MKKLLSILLVICLMFTSVFSLPVFAEGENEYLITSLSGKYKTQGRTVINSDGVLLAHYPATGIEFKANCSGDVYVTFNVINLGYQGTYYDGCYFTVIVDGVTQDRDTCHKNIKIIPTKFIREPSESYSGKYYGKITHETDKAYCR